MPTITLVDAAERLNLSPSTLRHQIRRGYFKAWKIGRDWVTTTGEVEKYRKNHAMDAVTAAKYKGRGRKSPRSESAH